MSTILLFIRPGSCCNEMETGTRSNHNKRRHCHELQKFRLLRIVASSSPICQCLPPCSPVRRTMIFHMLLCYASHTNEASGFQGIKSYPQKEPCWKVSFIRTCLYLIMHHNFHMLSFIRFLAPVVVFPPPHCHNVREIRMFWRSIVQPRLPPLRSPRPRVAALALPAPKWRTAIFASRRFQSDSSKTGLTDYT